MNYLDDARERFAADLYATEATDIQIDAAEPGYARCSFAPQPKHMNAVGTIQGGALFTLADFAFAVASNIGGSTTVSLTSQITFHTVARGDRVTAEARQIRAGRTTCYYNIDITDSTGRLVATAVITGYIHAEKRL